jgi:hypothetical protein
LHWIFFIKLIEFWLDYSIFKQNTFHRKYWWMETWKENMFHKGVCVVMLSFNELPRAKQMKLRTVTIIYKIASFYASWNKCKCIVNVMKVYIYTHTKWTISQVRIFSKKQMKHEKLTKCGKENFKFAIPRLNLFFEKT